MDSPMNAIFHIEVFAVGRLRTGITSNTTLETIASSSGEQVPLTQPLMTMAPARSDETPLELPIEILIVKELLRVAATE